MVIFDGIVERYQNRIKQAADEAAAEGAAREHEKWAGWNRRRLEAEARGLPFDEPPPPPPAKKGRNGR